MNYEIKIDTYIKYLNTLIEKKLKNFKKKK